MSLSVFLLENSTPAQFACRFALFLFQICRGGSCGGGSRRPCRVVKSYRASSASASTLSLLVVAFCCLLLVRFLLGDWGPLTYVKVGKSIYPWLLIYFVFFYLRNQERKDKTKQERITPNFNFNFEISSFCSLFKEGQEGASSRIEHGTR